MVSIGLTLFVFLLLCTVVGRGVQSHLRLRRRLREIENKAVQVSRLLRERGALANELAHEIKNPLTAIVCSAEALDHLMGGDMTETNRKCLGYIREYGHNLLHLISDYLDLSRVEAGFLKSEPVSIPFAITVQSIVSLLHSQSVRSHVTIELGAIDESLVAIADPSHVKKILFNLLRYAISVTPARGEVRITTGYQDGTNRVILSVKDSGPTLSADELNRLFDPQLQLAMGWGTEESISGLSLALSRALTEQEGGTFICRGEADGNYFEVTLPALADSMTTQSSCDTPEERPLSGYRYLLVDAHTGPRESVAKLIESMGGMVDQVTAASDAVRAITTARYDAVMLDESSEGYRAHELAEIFRAKGNGQTPRIIAAAKTPDDKRRAHEAGADACIDKPLSSKTLLASLRES